MDFEFSSKVESLRQQLLDFMDEHIHPNEELFYEQIEAGNRWETPAIVEDPKQKGQAQGLWNLFLPQTYGDFSPGLTNLEYAPLAEIMGRVLWASEVFNCSAPDTGNMEVLARYGNAEQQAEWLAPLLRGEIRSAFCMTEPDVASSDATNIATSINRDGDEFVISGHKWWSSGACNSRCRIYIVMGKTDPENENRYAQQSLSLVPADPPGVEVVRPVKVFGYDAAPDGHAEVTFAHVRGPASNLLLGEGRGFEIAQGRLGPGRIHHCMRLIGLAQRALESMCVRAEQRVAFGRPLSKQQSVREDIARSALRISERRRRMNTEAVEVAAGRPLGAAEVLGVIGSLAPS